MTAMWEMAKYQMWRGLKVQVVLALEHYWFYSFHKVSEAVKEGRNE